MKMFAKTMVNGLELFKGPGLGKINRKRVKTPIYAFLYHILCVFNTLERNMYVFKKKILKCLFSKKTRFKQIQFLNF